MQKRASQLVPKRRYLQIALNSTLDEAYRIINRIPVSNRILIEAGTPLIKRYGLDGIRHIRKWYEEHIQRYLVAYQGGFAQRSSTNRSSDRYSSLEEAQDWEFSGKPKAEPPPFPYVVADLKMMDRGETEVEIAASAGASAAVALGHAPIESLNAFIEKCDELGLDAMVDMMNVEYPLSVLKALRRPPQVVILHRGVDEERFNKEKQIPLYEIRRIKSNYDIFISIAGGDAIREVQRSVFNDADIVVVWKSFFQSTEDTAKLAEEFLKEIK